MMKLFEHKKILIGAGIIIPILAVFIYSNSLKSEKTQPGTALIKVSEYKDKFSGFDKKTKIKTSYLGDQSQNQYVVQYTFNQNDIDYIDAEIMVNKKTESFETNISGLPTTAKLSLFIDDNLIEDSIPVDWAGRLSLTMQNPDNKTLCLGIDGIQKRHRSVICHNPNFSEEGSVAS